MLAIDSEHIFLKDLGFEILKKSPKTKKLCRFYDFDGFRWKFNENQWKIVDFKGKPLDLQYGSIQ